MISFVVDSLVSLAINAAAFHANPTDSVSINLVVVLALAWLYL